MNRAGAAEKAATLWAILQHGEDTPDQNRRIVRLIDELGTWAVVSGKLEPSITEDSEGSGGE